MTEIRTATASNVRSFQILVNALVTGDDKRKEQINQEALEDEFGRFRVWSGNLGALQKGHSSLDYRLRDSPLLLGNALKLLEELDHNLNEAAAIISGARLPYEEQASPDPSEETDDEGDGDDAFYSEDDEDEETGNSKLELTMRYEEIVDIIDNLYKLSVRIRTPTIGLRSLKAASYQPKDPDTGVDILSSYSLHDKQHVRELLRYLRRNQLGEERVDDDDIASRLAHAITFRRRHFKYWKRHRDKLSVSTVLEVRKDLYEKPIAEAPNLPTSNELVEMHVPVFVPKNPLSQKTGKTMLSGTEATQHHQSLDEIVDTKSVTSYAATVTDIHGKGVNLPPPPKGVNGDRDFECPYCYIICPARYGRGRPWRTHLLQDLQPYICTFPECEASEQLFRSRREWYEHEASHRKAWRCPEHPSAVYRSRAGLEDHLRQLHLDSFPETQLDIIVKAGETTTIDKREKCPICFLPANAEGMGDFADHVANHLERFATFALPNSSEEDTDGASSIASRGRTSSTASQDASEMSLPSDISGEQGFKENLTTDLRTDEDGYPVHEKGSQYLPTAQSLLSAESLLSVPDVSQDRLDTLLARRSDEQDDIDEEEGEEEDEEDETPATADIEAHLERLENFRAYLLSLPGAQTVRFFKRYGAWRGHAVFAKATHTAQALDVFDKTLYPDVRVQRGTESNRNKLKFSVQNAQVARPDYTRQATLETQDSDDGISSSSILYDDEEKTTNKQAVLTISEIPTLHELYRSRKLLQRDQSFAPNDSHNRIVSFCYYDLTRMKVDAVVNSANRSLKISKHKPTLNYHIHKAGGSKFSQEAASKGKLQPGQVVLTSGHNLPCTYVIHASRPQYGKNKGMGQFNVLTECYRSALKIALASNLKTIAFPCLGTGGCGFPPRIAARVALQEVREFLDSHTQHSLENIIFVVKSVSDEKAYMDLFPAFFPPTHGDLDAARSSGLSASRASLAAQALDARFQVQKASQDLSSELSLWVSDFPKEILDNLAGIDEALSSIRSYLLGSKIVECDLGDLSLVCSAIQLVCGSVEELTEKARAIPYSGNGVHKSLWDTYNNTIRLAHGRDLEQLLVDCQDLAQYFDDVLTRNGVEQDDMAPIRSRLQHFKAKQGIQDAVGAHEHLDEVLYAREFQSETNTSSPDVVRLHQIPTVAQLYASQKLKEQPTMVQPSAVFNQIVCMVREDITKLEVTITVNSTDPTFAGMGTLDRKVFNKGGFELREEYMKFGVCAEGDVRLTGSYSLPSRHILHVVPPQQWTRNSKDILRQIYRELLHTAQSLKATSIAIPAIGTGMLNYPRRDCAALALEEVHRFLETTESTNLVKKIVFVVYSSNDEFVYKSLLPVYFPPVDRDFKRALPASHPISKSTPMLPETVPAPKKTLFGSISDAVRNLGSSRSKTRPVSHTWRAINSYEEHALIGFESHAQGCDTCQDVERLYREKKDLCEHGYPLAQTLLWYMNMGADQLVYTRSVQIRQSIRLEVPEDMFPLSLTLLRIVEASSRVDGRDQPWVAPNRAYTTVGQDDGNSGPTIYSVETARAVVETWSMSEQAWSPVSPSECILYIRPGKLDVYEAHMPSTAQEPLLSFSLNPAASIIRHDQRPGLIIRGAVSAQFDNNEKIMLVSQNGTDSDLLLAMLKRANPELSTSNEEHGGSPEGPSQANAIKRAEIVPDPASSPRTSLLSPSQENERSSEAASSSNTQPAEQRLAMITNLGGDMLPSNQPHPVEQGQDRGHARKEALIAIEQQILHYLTEDLKTRPGSFIGQTTQNIASALERPLEEVVITCKGLAKQDYIHNTANENTWVISHLPEELPVLKGSQPQVSTYQATLSPSASGSKSDGSDVLFQMELLEQQILSFFTAFNARNPLKKGCTAHDIAEALDKDVEEIELGLDQLAEQGRVHLAPDRETWNTPLPRQYTSSNASVQPQAGPSSEETNIRNATVFKDIPPSPIASAASTEARDTHANITDALSSVTLDTEDLYPYDPATRWTRIDASYVDPQALTDLGEDFHQDGYSLVVHRILRRGELKEWVQNTLDLRLKKGETERARRPVSGHTWLSKGKERDEGRDERDQRQANLDRLLAGDMKEDELRHFKADEEAEKKR